MPDPISKKIKIAVLSIHILFLGIIFFGSSLLPPKKKHKPLIVKTIVPKPTVAIAQPQKPKQAPAKPSASASAKPAAPPKPKIEKPAAPPKPAVPKVQPAKSPIPTAPKQKPEPKKDPAIVDKVMNKNVKTALKKETKPENRAKISDQLKKELEESIAKIEGKKQNLSKKQPAARSQDYTPIQLQIDAMETGSWTDADSDYPNLMIGYLHQSLHLPEFGEVKIQLTLRQDGSVAKLVVLNTESEKNKRYLEGSLPKLQFPSFNGSFAKKKEHTFVLTFCNEI
ncbi:MAG: flagellar hook-length control protein FliK [Parachlamydiales bacterium]|nr:flagellar hook-length control protein FliK [Candidatus Acheromyda pituitae]